MLMATLQLNATRMRQRAYHMWLALVATMLFMNVKQRVTRACKQCLNIDALVTLVQKFIEPKHERE